MAVKSIPDGYHSLTPYLVVRDAAKAIEFYAKAFGAVELYRMPMGGKIGHAEMKIGDSIFMLADEFEGMSNPTPDKLGGTAVSLMIYLDDVDTVFKRAIGAGATEVRPVENQFYGDRSGSLRDPFGHVWMVSTHVEDVSPEEMQRRMAAMA